MKIEYLYDIISLYNQKCIKNAAIERGISEITLKKHIELMQKEVGEIINYTSSSKIELTKEGLNFYYHAMRALADFTEYKLQNMKAEKKKDITVAMDINVFLGVIYICSDTMSQKYDVKFDIIHLYKNDVIQGVRDSKFDVGLIILDSLSKEKLKEHNLDYKHICTRRPVVIVSEDHPLANNKKVSLKELAIYERISLENSFEELSYLQNKRKKNIKLGKSNVMYKFITDILLSLKHSQFYFIGGCNEKIDLSLSGLRVLEIEELHERSEVVCIYPNYKPLLEPLKELLHSNTIISK